MQSMAVRYTAIAGVVPSEFFLALFKWQVGTHLQPYVPDNPPCPLPMRLMKETRGPRVSRPVTVIALIAKEKLG